MRATIMAAALLLPAVLGASIEELFREKESRALAFAERLSIEYGKRCDSFSGCAGLNYDNCVTAYPEQTCPADGIKVPNRQNVSAEKAVKIGRELFFARIANVFLFAPTARSRRVVFETPMT